MARNVVPKSAGAVSAYQSNLRIESTIIATTRSGRAVRKLATSQIYVARCNLYANEGGDFTRGLAADLGQNGNLSADPLFIDPERGNYHILPHSPCASDSIGARGVIGAFLPSESLNRGSASR